MNHSDRDAARKRLWELMDRIQNIDDESLQKAFAHHLEYTVCKYKSNIHGPDIYQALAYTIRDFLIDRWNETQQNIREARSKRVYYLSMEFLLGRLLTTNLVNLGMRERVAHNLQQFGYDLNEISEYEPDAGLGNGGLGRLAACFLESMATLDLPCCGASIRYEFGIFHQQIVDGYQKEAPDNWLARGNPWEIMRHDIIYPVYYYGYSESFVDDAGNVRFRWTPGETVMAQAYDILCPGYNTRTVNHLRLWNSVSSSDFNFDYFNHGDYLRAVEDKFHTETISKVLYPNENILQGKELRLKQEYMLVSSSVQDALATFEQEETDWNRLPDRVFFQLNDTHPALTVAELMRMLVDMKQLEWDEAWALTQQCCAYTNHTVMPEALETWDMELFGRLLPRHLQIIFEINRRFMDQLRAQGAPDDLLARMSLIDEGGGKKVRMANLAVVGSKAVNGVAELHTRILRERIFGDFHRLWPGRIQNKTNGITHRRWIVASNPELSEVITKRIGSDWIQDLGRLRDLEPLADDGDLQADWERVRRKNKERMAHLILFETGVTVDPDSIFDVQIKRIHEYKRQHLNILRVIADYQMMKTNPHLDYTPRTVIFGGKAAPGYHRAKAIIKLINAVAHVVNNDKDVKGRLNVVFLPNYRVSLAERIFPASDISEQISTAGMEASGTGNMKFMLNGALTLGTLDGANVEILEEVGKDNCYIFGLTDVEVEEHRRGGYDPQEYYRQDPVIRHALDAVQGNYFNRHEPGQFQELINVLLNGGDYYMVLADFRAYAEAQDKAARDFRDRRAWTRRSILNTARSGKFSSDRTIMQYAREIWNASPVSPKREPRIAAV
ncbi:MAG: glycogen/starch/alpha-glucan phosphorylase [Leptospirales bacterium]|nr:glycogen/starch/alpha-glucan phosphorylase [Leptospirales bacterium]